MLTQSKVSKGDGLAEILGVHRLKIAYEDMVFKTTGRAVQFPVVSGDRNAVNWKRNYDFFLKMHKRLRALGASPELYMTVMFTKPNKAIPDKRGNIWSYPYLQWLSSDKAFVAFQWKAKTLSSKYGYKSAAEVLRKSATDYTPKFYGSFATGFHILQNVKNSFKVGFLHKLPNRFAVFLAYSDVFSPEFVTTAQGMTDLLVQDYEGRAKHIQKAVGKYANPILNRGWKNPRYFGYLIKARDAVMNREEQLLRGKQELTAEKGNDIWQLLQ